MRTYQQSLLRAAMKALGMTRDMFSNSLGVKRRALDTWLLPDTSREYRQMPDAVRLLIESRWPGLASLDTAVAASLRDRICPPEAPHLLSVTQFQRDSLGDLLRLAGSLEPVAQRHKTCRVLEGAVLGNLFFEPSTRTRLSFGAAFCRLGGAVCDTTGFTFSSMAKGESLADTSRVVAGYFDAIVVRHPETGSVARFAENIEVPVVNGGDGAGEHPTQALVDVYTMEKEFARLGKTLDGATVALVGDLRHGRAVQSLFRILTLYRQLSFKLVAPGGLEMPTELIDAAVTLGHQVTQHSTLQGGLRDADLVYATRIQKERMQEEAAEGYPARFRIDKSAISRLAPADVVILHPLPRDSAPEANDLSCDLDADPRLAIFRQTDNGVAVRMAVFATLLGVEAQIPACLRDANWRRPARIGKADAKFHRLAGSA
ncbi:aspartate carbamoyltransferase [Uliginosibacterium sp. H3]|uniref:Aspartate carbamoyltransferase n=1 Tax=Uliginosibacterium silvisoli TaxID=3114758 RepID=A0ABU6K070_9RHOO|nr:aspartate carbamoyltransferase [Uliginosibacterium sp. H3]